jgi:hypothetical protein
MVKLKIGLRWGAALARLALASSLAAVLAACSSDLLSSPPASVTVSLKAAPTATPVYNGASIVWKTSTGAKSSVEYGTSAGVYDFATPQSSTAATDQAASITGLSASTAYYYRVVSYLGNGKTFRSGEYTFTTTAFTPVTFSTPVATPTYNTATVAFTTDLATTVSLEYGTAAGVYALSIPRDAVAQTIHSISLSGLEASTTYYYRVIAWSDATHTALSAEYQFPTSADPNVLAISVAPVETPTLTSLSIAWTSNFACTHFIEYGTSNGGPYTASTVATSTAATSHTELISGLASGTTYYYRIHMLWDTGADLISSQYSAVTTADVAPTAAQKARGVWIIGGLSGATVSTVVSAIDLYDPATGANGTWYPAAATTTGYTPVSFAACAAYGGKLYVFGGFDSTGATRNLVQIYTIATNSWTTGTAMPAVRANTFASVIGDKIYILGGTTAANATTNWAGAATTYEYSVSGNSWISTKVAFGTAGSERFSYAYDGTVYNLGGRTSAAGVVATHDGLLPSTAAQPVIGELDGAGVVETAMTAARGGFAGAVYKPSTTPAFVYVIGGISAYTGVTGCFVNFPTTVSLTPVNTVQYLHYPFAGQRLWASPTNQYPVTIAHGASVVTTAVSPARIIYFGGTTSLGASASGTANGYWIPTPPDPQTTWADTWTAISTASMSARWGQGAVTLNQ